MSTDYDWLHKRFASEAEIREYLEYLRGELRGERISQGELIDLQGLAEFIDPGDVELLEAAGVPEFPEEEEPPTVTEADGRVAFRGRNVTIATCDRCDFTSGLTECLCDHWHECAEDVYEPECDVEEEH